MIPYETYGKYWVLKPYLAASPYFVLAGISVILAAIMAYYEAKRRKLEEKDIIYSLLFIFISAAFFARAFHFLGPWTWSEDWSIFQRILYIFSFKAGMVFYGGLIGAIVGVFVHARIRKLDFWKYMDAWSPSCGILLFIARIGCFTAGCCFGNESSAGLPWLIQRFGEAIHPTQLYSSFEGILLFVVLTELKYRQAIMKKFDGWVFLWGILIYSMTRFFVEFFRYYDAYVLGLSGSQIVAFFLAASAAYFLIRRSREEARAKKRSETLKTPKNTE